MHLTKKNNYCMLFCRGNFYAGLLWNISTACCNTCTIYPGPVAVELSLHLLLSSQLHEGPTILHPLPLLSELPAGSE